MQTHYAISVVDIKMSTESSNFYQHPFSAIDICLILRMCFIYPKYKNRICAITSAAFARRENASKNSDDIVLLYVRARRIW